MSTVLETIEKYNLHEIVNRAISYNPNAFKPLFQIPVIWNDYRLKNSAGNANRWRIKFHPGLKDADISEITITFLHELAHVMDCLENGSTSHGAGWWINMARLGLDPRKHRYHNISSCKSRKDKNEPLNLDFS